MWITGQRGLGFYDVPLDLRLNRCALSSCCWTSKHTLFHLTVQSLLLQGTSLHNR